MTRVRTYRFLNIAFIAIIPAMFLFGGHILGKNTEVIVDEKLVSSAPYVKAVYNRKTQSWEVLSFENEKKNTPEASGPLLVGSETRTSQEASERKPE